MGERESRERERDYVKGENVSSGSLVFRVYQIQQSRPK